MSAARVNSVRLLCDAAREMTRDLARLRFPEPVAAVYNPLEYAWAMHQAYIERYAPPSPCRAVFVGMNPGPWGMAQTGVPFGEIAAVRDWMGLDEPVGKPAREHPKRPIEGLSCTRSEVSGRRLWGLIAATWGTAGQFFAEHFVLNYCPLVFMSTSGANITPDKLPAATRQELEAICDAHLSSALSALQPGIAIGVGGFAAARIERVSAGAHWKTGTLLHPSPASPIANREWPERPRRQLRELGLG